MTGWEDLVATAMLGTARRKAGGHAITGTDRAPVPVASIRAQADPTDQAHAVLPCRYRKASSRTVTAMSGATPRAASARDPLVAALDGHREAAACTLPGIARRPMRLDSVADSTRAQLDPTAVLGRRAGGPVTTTRPCLTRRPARAASAHDPLVAVLDGRPEATATTGTKLEVTA